MKADTRSGAVLTAEDRDRVRRFQRPGWVPCAIEDVVDSTVRFRLRVWTVDGSPWALFFTDLTRLCDLLGDDPAAHPPLVPLSLLDLVVALPDGHGIVVDPASTGFSTLTPDHAARIRSLVRPPESTPAERTGDGSPD